MKIPKKILHALEMRKEYAIRLMNHAAVVDDFIERHNIPAEDCDWLEIYVNPWAAYDRVLEAIKRA